MTNLAKRMLQIWQNLIIFVSCMLRDETLSKKLYEDLFKENREIFEFLAYSYVGDHEQARDIVSDCFAKLWEKRDSIISESVLAYMYKTVKNACLDYRKSARHNNEIRESLLNKEGELMELFTETIQNTDPSELFTEDILAIARESLKKVPDEQKQAFLKNRVEGLSYEEIAQAMGIQYSRVAKDIHAVLKRLRISLKDYLSIIILITLLKELN